MEEVSRLTLVLLKDLSALSFSLSLALCLSFMHREYSQYSPKAPHFKSHTDTCLYTSTCQQL